MCIFFWKSSYLLKSWRNCALTVKIWFQGCFKKWSQDILPKCLVAQLRWSQWLTKLSAATIPRKPVDPKPPDRTSIEETHFGVYHPQQDSRYRRLLARGATVSRSVTWSTYGHDPGRWSGHAQDLTTGVTSCVNGNGETEGSRETVELVIHTCRNHVAVYWRFFSLVPSGTL